MPLYHRKQTVFIYAVIFMSFDCEMYYIFGRRASRDATSLRLAMHVRASCEGALVLDA